MPLRTAERWLTAYLSRGAAAPVDRWLGGGRLPRMPESLDMLDLLLLTVPTPRKVHRDGIQCHGLR